jgi:hypothetical protein
VIGPGRLYGISGDFHASIFGKSNCRSNLHCQRKIEKLIHKIVHDGNENGCYRDLARFRMYFSILLILKELFCALKTSTADEKPD